MTPSKSQIIKAGAKAFVMRNPLIAIGGSALIIFIGWRLIKKAVNKENRPILPPIPPVPINPVEADQKKYTYLAQQYADFADAIESACDGPGTWDEEDIENVMKRMVTKADVLALIEAYGKRAITSPYGWDTDPMSLSQTLKYDLSPDYLEKYVNQPLRRTGYKF